MSVISGIATNDNEHVNDYVTRFSDRLNALGIRKVIGHSALSVNDRDAFAGYSNVEGFDGRGYPKVYFHDTSPMQHPNIVHRTINVSTAGLDSSQHDSNKIPSPIFLAELGKRTTVISTSDGEVVAVYYHEPNVILSWDLFHYYNATGHQIVERILTTVQGEKSGGGEFALPKLDLPASRNIVIFGDKVYRLSAAEFKTEDSFIEKTVTALKDKYTHQSKAMVMNYKAAVKELQNREKNLLRDHVVLPAASTEMYTSGITYTRGTNNAYVHARKTVKIKVNKIWSMDKPHPDKLPPEFCKEMVVLIELVMKPETVDTYSILSINVWTYNEKYQLVQPVHPHVTGVQMCVGSYKFPNPVKTGKLPEVFVDAQRLLEELNPRSWYGNGVDETFNHWLHEKNYL